MLDTLVGMRQNLKKFAIMTVVFLSQFSESI